MIIVRFAFVMLIINVMFYVVSAANIFSAPTYYSGTPYNSYLYYESSYIHRYNASTLPHNISTITETESYPTTMNIFSILLGSVTFGWVINFVPEGLKVGFAPFIIGLQAVSFLIYCIGIIELFISRYRNPLSNQ